MKARISYILIMLLLGGLVSLGSSILLNQHNNSIEENANLLQLSLLEDWVHPWNQYDEEYGRAIVIDESTGELYTLGYNGTTTNNDIILIKYSNSGDQLWNITWDGEVNEIGYDIALDSQKNIYIAGGNGTSFPNLDGLLLKFNSTGDLVWKRSYDGGSYDNFWALHIDSNDNIFVVSQSITTSYDAIVLKYNSSGNLQWISTFGGSAYQSCYDITLDSDGNIYLAGLNGSAPSYNYLIVKLDNSGNHLWNRTWGGGESDQAYAIGVDSFNNIYITGFSNSFGSPNKDITLVKYDTNGNKLWNTTWGSDFGDEAWAIAFDSAGYVYIGGYQAYGDVFILKFDSAGYFIGIETWERGSMYSNWCYDLIIDNNDNIYFTGHTLLTMYYDIITVKFSIESPGGFTLWSNADDPDADGNFTLFWTVSPRVNNYSLYYSNISADIDIKSESPWIESILDHEIDISLGNGTYYFLVVAHNNYGYAVSNIISVTIEKTTNGPPNGNGEEPQIPGYKILIFVASIGLISTIIAKKRFKN